MENTIKLKAKIVKIGIIEDDRPQFWAFDCQQTIPAIEITTDGILYAGWTIKELDEISRSGIIPNLN